MQTRTNSVRSAALFIAIIAVGCAGEPAAQDAARHPDVGSDAESPEAEMGQLPPIVVPDELPAVANFGNCAELPTAPGACEWVTQHDAIVIGVVTAIEAFFKPGWEREDCDGANGGLQLEVTVSETLYGEAPQQIRVRIGPEQLSTWNPNVITEYDEETFRWSGADAGLEVGMQLGIPLIHYPELELWSPSSSVLFAFPDNETLFQPVTDDCAEPAPAELTGLSKAEFEGFAAACDPTAGQTRRNVIDTIVSGDPTHATHANCWR